MKQSSRSLSAFSSNVNQRDESAYDSRLLTGLTFSCVSVAMSQFRAFAGVLKGGCFGGSQWLRGCGGSHARRCVSHRRSFSSGAALLNSGLPSSYAEEMYIAWLEDHESVHKVMRFTH